MLKPAVKTVPKSQPDSLSSSLLPWVFGHTVEESRLVVLDFGLATAASINFFAQFKCRLYFTGLIDSALDKFNDQELSHAERVKQFELAIDLSADTKLDIVLFWDLFWYLDKPAMGALLEALSPHMQESTRAHSIGLLNSRYHLPLYEYGIIDINRLQQQPKNSPQSKVYNHSRRDFSHNLNFFTIDKSCLLADGRIENVLGVNR